MNATNPTSHTSSIPPPVPRRDLPDGSDAGAAEVSKALATQVMDLLLALQVELSGEASPAVTLVTCAIDRQAQLVRQLHGHKEHGSGACPTFFRALCRTASEGGSTGYDQAGYGLAGALGSLAPIDQEDDEWQTTLEGLAAAISDQDRERILAWFDQWLPRCMQLVPARRRAQFVEGVLRAAEEGEADWM